MWALQEEASQGCQLYLQSVTTASTSLPSPSPAAAALGRFNDCCLIFQKDTDHDLVGDVCDTNQDR